MRFGGFGILPGALLVMTALSGCFESSPGGLTGPPQEVPFSDTSAKVVIAHIDTGINPYHVAFRSANARAWMHPSTYIPGYPAASVALNLSLDAPDLASALKADAEIWKSVQKGQLYWVPGTKIIGAISFGDGGRLCPLVPVPPANQVLEDDCPERRILDDFGHGTMTASRMAGTRHSLAPEALIVSIEGDAIPSLNFIAKAGWIDVVSNSWGQLVPAQAVPETTRAVENAAQRALFLFASGNGLGFINGVVGQPTYGMATGTPSVVLVGAHDNGYATTWHGFPVHVIADGYGGWRASHVGLTEWGPSSESCCTSTAAPYASGGAAGILYEARRILGDSRTGLRGTGDAGVLAEGGLGLVPRGPLADGKFTMAELKTVLEKTADPRPPLTSPSTDDGLIHWTATAGTPKDPWVGDNPYCVACFTSPVPLSRVPREANLVASIGYGAVTDGSLKDARRVLTGEGATPNRALEDQFFSLDQQLRQALGPVT